MSQRKATHKDRLRLHCGNCGKVGHTYKKCLEAIISLGVILYNRIQINNYSEIKFLLVQRRDSIGFTEFMRGKFQEKDENYLMKLIDIMTVEEKNRLLTNNYETLLSNFNIHKNSRNYRYEYEDAKIKFNNLTKNGRLKSLIESSKTNWKEPEWGFPKGRRHLKESDFDCACREFEEETGLLSNDYLIFHNVKPLEENFIGTNKIRYKHNYFLGKSCSQKLPEVNYNNKTQFAEIGNIGWFSFNEAQKKIRPYQREKIIVLKKAYSIIKAERTYFKEHRINYNNNDSILIINS